MKKIIVASKNPVKIRCVLNSFKKVFPCEKFSVEGVSADSGVKSQPMTSDEALRGSSNRVKNAQAHCDADYWVGIEGGVEDSNNGMEVFAWVVVRSKDQVGVARTGSFVLPLKISELIKQGHELGEADDIVFGESNSKQKNGAVGILTGDLITRTSYYEEAMILALIPFKNKDLYN